MIKIAKEYIDIIGGGLAGCEAAWQAVERGIPVRLHEMRPVKMTPAHRTVGLAELVCSNSLRAAALENAVGLLKEEMRRLDSLVIEAADSTKVPAGGALAVDRGLFSSYIEEKLAEHPLVAIVREEVTAIPPGITVMAAGPLASERISEEIGCLTGVKGLFFHDAVAPLISCDSIDMEKAFFASRYAKGGDDYLNCPMNKEEYLLFYRELIHAELHPLHEFEEDEKVFEGCMPIETMAKRGEDTMRFGPLKPVGIICPDGREAYAVVQLRQDNTAGTLYNMVGFQTRLKRGEQDRVFRLIPGLEKAEIQRYGMMHRNTYINSPRLLTAGLSFFDRPGLYFAGQITGVEGYVESAASGLLAGINAARHYTGLDDLVFPAETALGGLINYITVPHADFQPSNITFGLLPPLGKKERDKRKKNLMIAERALDVLEGFIEEYELCRGIRHNSL